MPASYEAIDADAEWCVYQNSTLVSPLNKSDTAAELVQSPLPQSSSRAHRGGETRRIIVEARDVSESEAFVGPGSPQTSSRRSQSAVRGLQHQSRSRSRTLSPQRGQRPSLADLLDVVPEQNLRTGKHGSEKDEKNKTSSAKNKASEKARDTAHKAKETSTDTKHSKTREKHSKHSDSNHRAKESSIDMEKSRASEKYYRRNVENMNKSEGLHEDNSAKTTHRSNTEVCGASPEASNEMYLNPRRTSSSLSSTDSARREGAHAAAVIQPQKHRKNSPDQSMEDLHLQDFTRYQSKAMMKKQKQSALRKAGISSHHRTDISVTEGPAYLQTRPGASASSVSASPIVGSLSQCFVSPLASPLGMVDALRGSSASDVSIFHDFQNPIHNDPPTLSPGPFSQRSKGGLRQTADDAATVSTATSSALFQRLIVKSECRSFDSSEEMSYYNYVSRHSILQLCTEDLMSDNWKLVDYALYRLCEVCCTVAFNSEADRNTAAENRIRFIKAGGHALIVGVMKKYPKVPDLQTSACRLIQNLISLDHAGAFGELFAAVYGMDCILASIQRFPAMDDDNDEVYRYACSALAAVVCSSFKMVQRLMQDPRNLRIFLEAMRSKVNSNAVGVCRVLSYIAMQPNYHNEIVIAGGLEEIAGEMKLYPENREVQLCGCEALGNLAKSSKSSDQADHIVNKLEGAHLIGAAMKAFPSFEELQEKACHALFNFSLHRNVQVSIKRAAGLSALGIALENFPSNQAIQEYGCATMKRLLEVGNAPVE